MIDDSDEVPATEDLWTKVKADVNGLVPCIAQDADSGKVLMMAWVNEDALALTLKTKWATYWSRSRKTLWIKGNTSGNRQKLVQIRLDCDGDTLIYMVQPEGPACHLNTPTCFSWVLEGSRWVWKPENNEKK